MTPGVTGVRAARRLNHMEFVYRPGERDLVLALFDLLGFQKHDEHGGVFLLGFIDSTEPADNFVAGSEVKPEQWEFDQALADALRQEPLATAFDGYKKLLERDPQWGMHVGIRFESLDEWEETVARVGDVGVHAPVLADRVTLRGVYRPGEPGAMSSSVYQAFIWTDVLASGSLAFGQQLELTVHAF